MSWSPSRTRARSLFMRSIARAVAALLETLIEKGRLAIHGLFPFVKVKEVGRETLMRHDPDLLSFRNLNTPEELEKARLLG